MRISSLIFREHHCRVFINTEWRIQIRERKRHVCMSVPKVKFTEPKVCTVGIYSTYESGICTV